MSTFELLREDYSTLTPKQQKTVMSELCNRFLGPLMNFILAALCLAILLRSSLLRRRASFAPAAAVIAMSGVMAAFMSASNMLTHVSGLWMVGGIQLVFLAIIMVVLYRK